MAGIKAFSSSLKGLGAPRTQPTARTEQQFITMTPTGFDKHGLDVVLKAHYPVGGIARTIDAVQPTEDADRILNITGHGMRQGDIIRFAPGSTLEGIESEVVEIVDANTIVLATKLPSDPVAGSDQVELLRGVTLRTGSDGSLVATSGPLQFNLNTGLGPVPTQVLKDTVSPANTIPLPVELISTTGTPAEFNITTGEINIHTSHDGTLTGIDFDSMRIGDGTNLAAVNASLQLETRDAPAEVLLTSIDGKDFATQTTLFALLTELEAKADLSETQPVSAASLPLPTGAATEVTLEAARVLLASIAGEDFATQTTLEALLTELEAKADLTETQPVSMASAPLPTDAATETTLALLEAKDFATQTTLEALLTELALKADLTETQPVSAASLPLPTGATQQAQLIEVRDSIQAIQQALNSIDADALNVLSDQLPSSLGPQTKATSLSVTFGSDETAIETREEVGNAGVFASLPTTGGSADIYTPSPECIELTLQADVSNAETIRVGIGAGNPTASSGYELLPGASVTFKTSSEIRYFSTTAGQVLNIVQNRRV